MNKKIILVKEEIAKQIVGQDYMVDRVLLGLFTGGHILLEGLPGLAKSFTVNTIAQAVGLDFKRIQFTPDLLPSDIVGTDVYYQNTGKFAVKQGPIFSNIILADEINRAPAKVQSALLEAMQERQVTIGEKTFKLEDPFIVLATQNPIEQDGTYPLPEAQQDRFMLKLSIGYPSKTEELQILNRFAGEKDVQPVKKVLDKKDILAIRDGIKKVHIDDHLKQYIVDLVLKTREPSKYMVFGASPRATLSLVTAAKGMAYMNGRDYVDPADIKSIAKDVLRHRISLSYEAEAENVSAARLIDNLLESVRLP